MYYSARESLRATKLTGDCLYIIIYVRLMGAVSCSHGKGIKQRDEVHIEHNYRICIQRFWSAAIASSSTGGVDVKKENKYCAIVAEERRIEDPGRLV